MFAAEIAVNIKEAVRNERDRFTEFNRDIGIQGNIGRQVRRDGGNHRWRSIGRHGCESKRVICSQWICRQVFIRNPGSKYRPHAPFQVDKILVRVNYNDRVTGFINCTRMRTTGVTGDVIPGAGQRHRFAERDGNVCIQGNVNVIIRRVGAFHAGRKIYRTGMCRRCRIPRSGSDGSEIQIIIICIFTTAIATDNGCYGGWSRRSQCSFIAICRSSISNKIHNSRIGWTGSRKCSC